jgi:hypothetical protein
VKDVDA